MSEWERISAQGLTLEVIREGYKILLFLLRNTEPITAMKEADFVCEAILDLVKMNCMEELSEVPNIVNPLSVSIQSPGKKRLILDLRYVNLFV